ncbi:uncharacterized protein LOC120695245 [Panicum virgatum]|uniref:Uncharacterized protein n=1 Tax=Panicum virgatum TaxID=38727 RepID=A0A8T0WH95_PANVG|nr:uncharacterized protein LOC120695245 [Panicum virgatum]KAG2642519.1 hypothetical protein PVAP13_2KG092100 [Panicum virgatum]
MRIGMLLCIGKLNTLMADHLLHIPPSNDLKLRAQRQPPTKALLKILRIRRLVRAFVSKHVVGRVAAAMDGARAVLLDLLSKKAGAVELSRKIVKRKRRGRDKDPPCICGGCVEVHLNLLPPSWSSSSSSWPETTAVPEPHEAVLHYYSYYDPTWNTVIPAELQLQPIARYLEWHDEERQMEDDDDDKEDGDSCHEIDNLAERFIARCHERFMLEKQESYRRYQEMLARSL